MAGGRLLQAAAATTADKRSAICPSPPPISHSNGGARLPRRACTHEPPVTGIRLRRRGGRPQAAAAAVEVPPFSPSQTGIHVWGLPSPPARRRCCCLVCPVLFAQRRPCCSPSGARGSGWRAARQVSAELAARAAAATARGGCSAQREALPARFSRFRPSLSTDAVGQRTESGRGRTYRCRRGTARCQAPRGDVAVVQVRAAAAPRKRWGEGGVPQPPPFGVTQAVATKPVGVGGPCGTARPAVTKYGQPRLFAPVMRLVRTQTGAELDGIAHSASNAPPQTPHQTRTVQRPHPPPPHPPSPPTKMVLSRGAGR